MTASPVQPLDFSGLHTYSVHDRHSKVSIDDFAAPVRPGMSLRELLAGLPRQLAYENVQRLAMRAWEERSFFPELVRADAFMREHLSGDTLDTLFDPASYLHYEQTIYNRVFGNI